ncbi:ribbon-helix-helix domain-containing protein [Priestia filamentosa]|uniref:ribbon-helix-helix domain-containing protein n=1 Tax=Priestia filamentosa TaxID=1402861 RepID=UPI000B0665F8
MARIESQRIDIRIPKPLLEKIEEYQKEEGFSTRTAALLDLTRKGIEFVENNKKNK